VEAVEQDITFDKCVFVPVDDPSDECTAPRQMATRMCYTTTVHSNVITLRRFRDSVELPSIALRPAKTGRMDALIEAFVKNEPPLGIKAGMSNADDIDVDVDFELVYPLAAQWPERTFVPKNLVQGNLTKARPCLGFEFDD
jgi:hypothetical protein